jgi:urease accessory protein
MNNLYVSALLIIGLVLSNAVHAHIGMDAHGSFAIGLMHPFSGLDHLLAMVAVGLWAAQMGGRALFVLPGAFVFSMALGTVLGYTGATLPFAEAGIAMSVIVLGALVAFAVRGSWQVTAPFAAVFALFHGYAHGAGLPEFSSPAGYLAGVLMATASLHAFGVAAGVMVLDRSRLLRAGGAAISLAGAFLLFAA